MVDDLPDPSAAIDAVHSVVDNDPDVDADDIEQIYSALAMTRAEWLELQAKLATAHA